MRSVTVKEPEFDAQQVSLLFGHLEIEDDTGRFGERLSEAMSAEADPNNPDGKYRYVVDSLPSVNWAAKARLDAEDAYKKQYPEANMNGLVFPFQKVDRISRGR